MKTIKKKEHLNDKTLYTEIIPQGISGIEDWAYSGCSNLSELFIPVSVSDISPKAFKGCDRLDKIFIYEDDPQRPVNKDHHLLALSVGKWPEKTGFLIKESVESEKFHQSIDELLCAFLEEPDEIGFDPFPAGGEEDYEGEENDLPLFIMKKQELKAHFIYERLRTAEFFKSNTFDRYTDYLKKHRTDGAFTFLLRHSLYENAYRKMYLDMKLPEEEELPGLIQKCGDDVELKSMLIRYGQSFKVSEKESEDTFSKKYII